MIERSAEHQHQRAPHREPIAGQPVPAPVADLAVRARLFAAAFNAACDAEGIPVSRAARKRALAVLPGGRS